jgi:ATP-dependent DNA ligase
MKTLPTLYSRTSTGAVQQWTIETSGNKFRTISGQVDGAKVETEWTICESKNVGRANATTPEQQAELEAQAKWDKKAKTGYTTDVSKIDSCAAYIEPMLAKELDEYIKKIDFSKGVLVQNKYNGVRCTATFDGSEVVLKSRKGELWIAVPHINRDLVSFFQKYPDAVLDGELFNNDLREKLNELTSIVRKTKAKSISPALLKRSEEIVKFYVYDGFGFDGWSEEDDYIERKAWIDDTLPKFSKYYRHVKTDLVYSMAEVDVIYGRYLEDKQEGAIIRIPNSPYQVGKRSKFLLKYKPEHDSEGIIEAVHEGTGDWAGAMKTATLRDVKTGKTFDATFMGSLPDAKKRWQEKHKWLKKEVTYKYTGLTAYGIPNYARIDPDNCFKGDR